MVACCCAAACCWMAIPSMPNQTKAGLREGGMCTLEMRLRVVRTLAMSYRRRTLVLSLLMSSGGSSPPAGIDKLYQTLLELLLHYAVTDVCIDIC